MTLAWFTPLSPARSGISKYSAELLPELGRTHEIDVFVADEPAGTPAGVRGVFDAHEFLWKHASDPV